MPLKAVVTDLDSVDENLRTEYAPEKGPDGTETGRFVLNVEPVEGYEIANTTNLRSALDAERNNYKQTKSELKKFEGIDPEQYRATTEELKKLKEADPDREKAVQELLEQRVQTFKETSQQQIEAVKKEAQTELEKAQGTTKVLQSKLERILVHKQAETLAAKVSPYPDLLAPQIVKYLSADLESDEPRTVFTDGNGTPRTGKQDFNKPLTESEFLEEISNNKAFAPLIRGPENSGTDSTTSQFKFKGGTKKYDPKANKSERFAAIKSKIAG